MSTPLKQVIRHLHDLRIKLEQLEAEDDWQSTIEQRREVAEQYANVNALIKALPVDVIRQPVADYEVIKGEWFYQPGITNNCNRLLYLHGCGGAFAGLSARLHFAAKIAKYTGSAVFAVNYRQLPQCPYLATPADCLAAYAWILTHGPEKNNNALHTYILGEAEGGTLALSTLLNIKQRYLKLPNAVVALSPLTDWTGASKSWTTLEDVDPFLSRQFLANHWAHFLDDIVEPDNPIASPLYGDLEGLPPILLQVGDREILLDDAKRFAEKVTAAKGQVKLEVFPDMPHAFQLFSPFLDESTIAIKQIVDFIHTSTTPRNSGEVIYMQPKS